MESCTFYTTDRLLFVNCLQLNLFIPKISGTFDCSSLTLRFIKSASGFYISMKAWSSATQLSVESLIRMPSIDLFNTKVKKRHWKQYFKICIIARNQFFLALCLICLILILLQLKPILEYDGDPDQLGNAEQFYLELHTLKGYKLRIDAMVLRLDFKTTVDRIKPAIEMYIKTCENLMDNEDLKIFLRFVLHTGNFLNSVSKIPS